MYNYFRNVNINEYEPVTKKQKYEICDNNILESNFEGKTRKSQSQFKTTINYDEKNEKKNKKNDCDTCEIVDSTIIKIGTLSEPSKIIESTDSHKVGMIWCRDMSKLIEKILNDDLKNFVDDSDNDNDSDRTISSIENTENVCDESLKTVECNSSKVGMIWCCDMRKLIETFKLENFFKNFGLSPNILQTAKTSEKKPKVIAPINQTTQYLVEKKDKTISVIELLYQKYFSSKSVQNNITIIANILILIWMYDEHHKKQMDYFDLIRICQNFERYYSHIVAVSTYLKHSNIIKFKLKRHFSAVLSHIIVDSDFEQAFKMFFSSIFNLLNVTNHRTLNDNTFKNVADLLGECLKDNTLITMTILKSETFHSDCMDLIRVIEDSRGSDPNITDRMPIFFKSSVNNQELIFQKMFNTVTSINSNENLAILLDIITLKFMNNSKFYNHTNINPTTTVR